METINNHELAKMKRKANAIARYSISANEGKSIQEIFAYAREKAKGIKGWQYYLFSDTLEGLIAKELIKRVK